MFGDIDAVAAVSMTQAVGSVYASFLCVQAHEGYAGMVLCWSIYGV